jgi:6-phosphofructokinase 1
MSLTSRRVYGGGEVWGIQYGFEGFYSKESPPVLLDLQAVRNLHQLGGTILGSSRGGFQLEQIIGGILARNFNQLYIIGGDGTHRGAQAIYQEIRKRQLPITVIGIPKTIDNDVCEPCGCPLGSLRSAAVAHRPLVRFRYRR